MKKYSSQLMTPLRINRLKEKMKKLKLAEAIAVKTREEKILIQLESKDQKTQDNIKQLLLGCTTIGDLTDYQIYSAGLLSVIDSQKAKVRQSEELFEITRASFIKSRIDRQILEKLEDKKINDYNMELIREEQKNSDESANINYILIERNRPNGET